MSSFCDRVVDPNPMAVDLHPGALVFGHFGVLGTRVIDKAKATREPRLRVVHQLNGLNRTKLGKDLFYVAFSCVCSQSKDAKDSRLGGIAL